MTFLYKDFLSEDLWNRFCSTVVMNNYLKNQEFEESYFKFDWSGFALIEFLLSEYHNIPLKFKKVLDIGSGEGIHTEILRRFDLEVDQIDKYSDKAEIKEDFISHNFKNKYDVVFCSHVIEHQRNPGNFLDKIYDVLNNEGLLIISAPKHETNIFVSGHLSCWHMPYFIQNLIHAGFDCNNCKMMSIARLENSFIIPKAKNFNLSERLQDGYVWTEEHQERSPVKLKPGLNMENDRILFHNCKFVIPTVENNTLDVKIDYPENFVPKNIVIDMTRWKETFIYKL